MGWNMSKPIIGISTCFEKQGAHNYHQTGHKYITAISDVFNGFPLLIPSLGNKLDRQKLFEIVDGLLFTGSYSNIEPHNYGGKPSDSGTKHDSNRDKTILPLIPEAIDAGIPILAICRGFQEMNVAYGGSLHQKVHEVNGMTDHREDSSKDLNGQYDIAHKVKIAPHGILDQISDEKEPMVNSVHWQGVDQLGNGLKVEGTAPDGLVEAFSVYDSHSFALSVQWHPEWKVMEDLFYKSIFKKFGDACLKHKLENN